MSDTENSNEITAQDQTQSRHLQACIGFVLSFYRVRADLQTLLTQSALDHGLVKEDDISLLLHKVGLKARRRKMTTEKIKKNESPCIVINKEGEPLVVLPQNTHEGKVFHPLKGVVDDHLQEGGPKESYIVYSILPEHLESGQDTSHMYKTHVLDWFWAPILRFWPHYSEVLLATVFINIFVIVLPLYTLNVYDRVIPNFAESTLAVLTIGIIIALIFDFLLKTTRAYVLEHVAGRVGIQYDFDLMERMMLIHDQNMPLSTGEKVNIFREMQGMRDFYAAKLAPTLVDMPFFIMFLFVIHMISPALSWIPLCGALVIIAINMSLRVLLGRMTEKHFRSMQKKTTLLVETLGGSKTFKMFNGIGSRLFEWNAAATNATERARYNQFLITTITNLSMSIMHIIHISVVVAGVYQIQAGYLTIGGLIACSILSSRSMGPVMALAGVLGQLQQASDVLRTIDKIFQMPHEGQDISSKSTKGPFKGVIELHDIEFTYPGAPKPALQGMNITIQPGESIGLIGKTGAGKSTLASLISGFLDGYQGRALIDSYALTSIAPAELRSLIGIVPQNPFFFSGTLQDNILAGRENFDKETFDKALYLSGMDLVMKESGYGLDMQVQEGGKNLSGGQRQAIALARAFLHDPQILIFDEPTTGMDQVLEARIKQTLSEYIKGRTFIMITHRTTLLSLVNRLILLDKGIVLADGGRQEVLDKLSGKGQGGAS